MELQACGFLGMTYYYQGDLERDSAVLALHIQLKCFRHANNFSLTLLLQDRTTRLRQVGQELKVVLLHHSTLQ